MAVKKAETKKGCKSPFLSLKGDTNMAVKKAETKVEEPSVAETKVEEPKFVEVFVPIDRQKGSSVFYSVNGNTGMIKRGEWVKVSPAVAEVIENSLKQDKAAEALIQREVESSGTEFVKM